MMVRTGIRSVLAALSFLVVAAAGDAAAEAYFDKYGLSRASPAVDVGVQPLGYPSGVLSAVMKRDRLLLARLDKLGFPLKTHSFLRGADMVELLNDGRLEVGFLGDMPTLLSAAGGQVWVVGLIKQSPTAIVTRGDIQMRHLAGKRIAYVEASSAHQTLLHGLASARLTEKDVRLVNMRVDEMPAALHRGEVDAFAAWEPAPSQALAASDNHRIVYRGTSTDYLVLTKDFAQRAPQAVEVLVAAYVRAIEWMRLSQKNQEKAAQWAKAENEDFSGKTSDLPLAQIANITRKELLNVPSAPRIIFNSKLTPPLKGEFDFLQRLGKLPVGGSWGNVEAALNNTFLVNILSDPQRFETGVFDYQE